MDILGGTFLSAPVLVGGLKRIVALRGGALMAEKIWAQQDENVEIAPMHRNSANASK
jgi:hypothetical protein